VTSPTPEPTLATIQRECPDWRCWYAHPSGTYYAIHASHPPRAGYQVRAGTPADLLQQIRVAADGAAELPVVPLGAPFGAGRTAVGRTSRPA
jgi:hypothetical protein